MLDRYLRIGLRETGDTKGFSVSSIFGFYLTRADLRHSHVSLLINMGFTPQLIAERIGDTVQMVNSVYGHLYPSKHEEVADRLNQLIVP